MRLKSDYELVLSCREGKAKAWDELLNRYQRLIYFVLQPYGLRTTDMDDVVQQTFLSCLNSLHVFHENSNVKGWLVTVAKRHAWRILHQYDHENVSAENDLTDTLLLNQKAIHDDSSWELTEWLVDGLNALGGKCRHLLYLIYFENGGLKYDQIAANHNIPRGSIGPTRTRCLKKLRKILGVEQKI